MKMKISLSTFLFVALSYSAPAIAAGDLGVQLFDQGRFQEALPVLAAEAKQRPKDANLQYYLANTCARLNDHASAVQHYNDCIKIDGNSQAAKYSKLALLNYVGNTPANTAQPADPDEHAHAKAMVSAVTSIRKQTDEKDSVHALRGYRQSRESKSLNESARNLEELLDSGANAAGVSLKPEGTNLYTRNYKTPESMYLHHTVKKALTAPQDKLVFDEKKKPHDKK
jgi:tetratricopeptide (TPR) repeat protein